MTLSERPWLTVLLTVVFFGMTACSSGPPPKLYLLEAAFVDDPSDDSLTSSLTALGISQVSLPGYASDQKIASNLGNGSIVLLDSQRWAEEPEDAITRLLAERLRARASATVLIEPWPRDYQPQARIDVVFDRLLNEADGGAHLVGHIQLISENGRSLLQSVPFEFRASGRSTNIADYFKAVALGVDDIARIAVNALLALRAKS